MGELSDKAKVFRLKFSANAILGLLQGQPLDEVREKNVQTATDYLESALRGLRYVHAGVYEGNGFLGWQQDLENFNIFTNINPRFTELGPRDLIAKLDTYTASLRTLGSEEGSIPEEIRTELIEFYRALTEYHFIPSDPVL